MPRSKKNNIKNDTSILNNDIKDNSVLNVSSSKNVLEPEQSEQFKNDSSRAPEQVKNDSNRVIKKSKNLMLDVVDSPTTPKVSEVSEVSEISFIKDSEESTVNEITKPKSTRGRKPKPKPDVAETQLEINVDLADLPKKSNRGRKPKPRSTETLAPLTPTSKRKGKNPKESYGFIQDDDDEDDPFFKTSVEESKEHQETPILKLNITAKDIQKLKDPNTNFLEGDNELNIPHGFIPATDTFSYFQSNPGGISMMKEDQKMTEKEIEEFRLNREKELEDSTGDLETSKLLCQYLEHNRKGTWPTKSNYDCMWCRYPFENVPWAVPTKLKDNDKYEVFGNFCSAGCVAAFIFDKYNDDEMWDYYALLNMLYQKVYQTTSTVKTAPSTLLLKKLGGILSIEEFRDITRNPNHDYFVKMPPMVSIIPSVEEIQQTSLFNDRGSHNQLNKELMMKASNELRLKRSKPIYDKNNTLDNYFHISGSELQN
jgi:hypothetical protein